MKLKLFLFLAAITLTLSCNNSYGQSEGGRERTPFEVLELPEGATFEEVQKAYRRLSQKLHPDKNNGKSEGMQELNRAYKVLKTRHQRGEFFTSNSFDMDDMDISFEKQRKRVLLETKPYLDNPTEENLLKTLSIARYLLDFTTGDYLADAGRKGLAADLIEEIRKRLKNPSKHFIKNFFQTIQFGYITTYQLDDYPMQNAELHRIERATILTLRKLSVEGKLKITPTEVVGIIRSADASYSDEVVDRTLGYSYRVPVKINETSARYLSFWAIEAGDIRDHATFLKFSLRIAPIIDSSFGEPERLVLAHGLAKKPEVLFRILEDMQTKEQFYYFYKFARVLPIESILYMIRYAYHKGFITTLEDVLKIAKFHESVGRNSYAAESDPEGYKKVSAKVRAVRMELVKVFKSFVGWEARWREFMPLHYSEFNSVEIKILKATPKMFLPSIQQPNIASLKNKKSTLTSYLNNLTSKVFNKKRSYYNDAYKEAFPEKEFQALEHTKAALSAPPASCQALF